MTTDEIAAVVSGAVLAGGKSTRMGRSKAHLPYHDGTFVERAVKVLESVFRDVAIISDDPTVSRENRIRVHADVFKECGPLGGIHSALVHTEKAMVFVCPTDTPLVTAADIRDLLAAALPGMITVACEEERWHPLFGVYPVQILPELESALRRRELRMRNFIKGCSCGYRCFPLNESAGRFVNINTPDEFENLMRKDTGSSNIF
jgi:molybdopterin-guanine dinucleotide biosynthesis protein A